MGGCLVTGGSLYARAALGLLASEPLRLSDDRRQITPRRVIVVSLGENPTLDYYLRPRLAAVEHQIVSPWSAPETALASGAEGAFVLFCRYFSGAWIRAIARHRGELAGVGLFLDDDIDAVIADRGAPLDYRFRLTIRHLLHRRRLSGRLDRLWVSTPALARRFAAIDAEVAPPLPEACDRPRPHPARERPRLGFHATGVHYPEHVWLAPILQKLLSLRPEIDVEVIADRACARLWGSVAGVKVTPPMSWTRYREYTAEMGFDLLLAPLIDSPANRCRAPTKRIDAYRAGAALVTTAPWVYAPTAEEAALGMSAPHEPEAFLATLIALIDSADRRAKLAALNANQVRSMAAEARPLFSQS